MESSSNWRSGKTGQQKKQSGLNDAGFTKYPKKTRKAHLLDEMDRVVPWFRLITLVEPHYPKAGRGRRSNALETMLRIHIMQQWFTFSDPVKGSRHEKLAPWQHEINHRLSRLRARVEHPFRVVKRQFGFTKVLYRGLGKNTPQLTTLLALSNLYLVRRQLLGIRG